MVRQVDRQLSFGNDALQTLCCKLSNLANSGKFSNSGLTVQQLSRIFNLRQFLRCIFNVESDHSKLITIPASYMKDKRILFVRQKLLLALLQTFGGRLDKVDFQKYLFQAKCSPYDNNDAFCKLVQRVEGLISKENTQWSKYVEKTKKA